MRRRRRHLEVSTFPFLAVLLCTMGSLILLLLVLDRRAKIVALHKVRQDAEQQRARTADDERLAAEHRAEYERRRQELHTLLVQQEVELLGQIEQTRGKLAEAAAK